MNATDPPQSLGPMVVVDSIDGADSVDGVVLDDAASHHLRRVLRRSAGDPVVLCDGRGSWVPGRLGERAGAVEVTGASTVVDAPARLTTVAFALVKGDRPDTVVRHLTELGVGRIIPMLTERTVVRWSRDKSAAAHDRLVRVATEACQQCRRTHVPEVASLMAMADVTTLLASESGRFALAVPGGADAAQGVDALLVGPEGGWTDSELAGVAAHVDIGPHVLRAETAALVAGVTVTAAVGSR